MSIDPNEFYSVAEVAKLLHVHAETVLRWIRRGQLPALTVARRHRIRGADILAKIGQREHDKGQR